MKAGEVGPVSCTGLNSKLIRNLNCAAADSILMMCKLDFNGKELLSFVFHLLVPLHDGIFLLYHFYSLYIFCLIVF